MDKSKCFVGHEWKKKVIWFGANHNINIIQLLECTIMNEMMGFFTFEGLVDVVPVVVDPVVILYAGIAVRHAVLGDDDFWIAIVVLDKVQQLPKSPGNNTQPTGPRSKTQRTA